MRLVIPLEMPDMKGGMLQSVELLLRFLPASVEKIVFVPGQSLVADRMKAAGASVVRSVSEHWTLSSSSPVSTMFSLLRFRSELNSLIVPETILLTNNIAAELLCGLGASGNGVTRIFVNRGDRYAGVSARALRRSLRSCRKCIATTKYQRHVLHDTLGVAENRIAIIPNGVDCAELDDVTNVPMPAWRETGALHLAAVGFPSERKNQELLIRAVAKLRKTYPNVRGLIIGSPGSSPDEQYLSFLKRITGELELSDVVRFIPFVEDKRELFSGIDILISTSRREGFGRTIIEAMAAGRPVIARRAGGPENIIEHGVNGLLVSGDDPEELAGAVGSLISDPGLRASLVSNARAECSARYNAQSVAAAYYRIFTGSLGLSS